MTLPTDLAERCRAFALALPDDVAFSHVTAARLWGLPLPVWAQDAGTLDVMRHAPPAIERASCRGHRGLERRTVRTTSGVRVTGLIDTWVDLAEVTQPQQLSVEDLVVVADEVLMRMAEQVEVRPGEEEWEAIARFEIERMGSRERPDRRAELAAVLAARVRARGAIRLRESLRLARVGSRSPMETRARLLVVRRGFPEPELNVEVSGVGGWLLEGDLVWRRAKVIGEYQGEHHGGRRQRSIDVGRRSLVEDEGWKVVEFWAEDLYQQLRRRALLCRLAAKLGLDPEVLDLS